MTHAMAGLYSSFESTQYLLSVIYHLVLVNIGLTIAGIGFLLYRKK